LGEEEEPPRLQAGEASENIPATPLHYDLIIRLNEKGIVPNNGLTELEAGANRCVIS
jgi:hypothetical protein